VTAKKEPRKLTKVRGECERKEGGVGNQWVETKSRARGWVKNEDVKAEARRTRDIEGKNNKAIERKKGRGDGYVGGKKSNIVKVQRRTEGGGR